MRPTADLEEAPLELAQIALHRCVKRSVGDHPHAAESTDEFRFCLRLARAPGRRGRLRLRRLGRSRRAARSRRRRRGLAWVRGEPADPPTETPLVALWPREPPL